MPTKQYSLPKQKEEKQLLEKYKQMKGSLTNIEHSLISLATRSQRNIPQKETLEPQNQVKTRSLHYANQ